MINLDNIFNKFFPKSKTAPMGKKLIVFAWIIEIIVACVGLSIAVLFFTAGSDMEVAQVRPTRLLLH